MPRLLDVTVEHGGVGAQAQGVRFAMDVEPVARVGLVLADLVADLGMENFRSAPRQAAQPGLDHLLEHPADRLLGDEAEPVNFDRRPGLDVQLGIRVVNDADDVEIPIERLEVMQPADDMDFGRAGPRGFEHAFANHLVAEFVRLGSFQVRTKRAERAAIDADVRRIEMDVGVVEREVAVLPLANDVCQTAQGQDVDLFVEKNSLVERQPFAGFNLVFDRLKCSFAIHA